MIRTGDSVKHGPTGETWLVAYVDGDYLAWCGWPEGEAKLADCTLIKSCTDEQHENLLREIADGDFKSDKRAVMARRILAAMHLESKPVEENLP